MGKFFLKSSVPLMLLITAVITMQTACLSAEAFKLPDTGQTKCYDSYGSFVVKPCEGTGQDGAYAINIMSLTDNNDGTITDNNTSLMWQKEDNNLTSNWYWANEGEVCGALTLGGFSDWRLPSKKELISIVNYGVSDIVAVTANYFPDTKPLFYWTSTTNARVSDHAWTVYFNDGGVYNDFFSHKLYDQNYARCVRGGQILSTFNNSGGGTVTDNKTGLMWQQEEPGHMMWEAAISYCEMLSLGNHDDWRLPNIKELESLTDDTQDSPAINTTFFPQAFDSFYWSATSYGHGPGNAWVVDFGSLNGDNFANKNKNDVGNYVRCVRGGQCANPPFMTGGSVHDYSSLQLAYDGLTDDASLRVHALTFNEDLILQRDISMTLQGGYNCEFTLVAGFTTIHGSLSIILGTVAIENIVIQ